MKESDLMRLIQLEASEHGAVLFRNSVGFFKQGDRAIRYGLCVGSSDLIGWTKTGRFLAIEVKTARVITTPEQINFLHQVNMAGGLGFVARSVQDVIDKLTNIA